MILKMNYPSYSLTAHHFAHRTGIAYKKNNILKQDSAIPYSLEKDSLEKISLGKFSVKKNSLEKENILNQDIRIPYSLDEETKGVPDEYSAGSLLRENSGVEMNFAEIQVINRLKGVDAEVRAHEHAHIAAAGGVATGGPTYIFLRGPDGRLYAVGGEVSINSSPVPGNPEKTIEKAQKIRRAALAPANPSSQDMRVAAAATRMEQQARMERRQEQAEEKKEQEESQPGKRDEDILHPGLQDIYSDKAKGISEEANQYIDLFV